MERGGGGGVERGRWVLHDRGLSAVMALGRFTVESQLKVAGSSVANGSLLM